MSKTLTKIVVTEALFAVAITLVTLLIAQDSLVQLRLVAATLIGLRALLGVCNVIAKNAVHLARNSRRSARLAQA